MSGEERQSGLKPVMNPEEWQSGPEQVINPEEVPEMEPAGNVKSCPNCGKPLPEGAAFCPFCEKVLVEKEEIVPLKVMPKRRKITAAVIAAVVLCIAAVGLILFLKDRQKIQAETWYTYEGKQYHLVLRHSLEFIHLDSPQELAEKRVVGVRAGAVPSQLYVLDAETGENAKELFQTLIENVEVSVEALDKANGEVAELGNPVDHPGFPKALYEADVIFSGNVRDNRILWTLTMKDGKKLTLSQRLHIISLASENYDYQSRTLENGDDLRALLEEIRKNGDPDTVYTINLGPYEYDGDFLISGHAVNLAGTEKNGQQTTIGGTLTVETRFPYACEITDILFTGCKTAAVIDKAGAFYTRCELDSADVGIQVSDGGYAMPSGCTFRNCRIGLFFNSNTADSKRTYFDENHFVDNETAVLLKDVPGDDILMFPLCVFEGNGKDIDNRTAHELDLSETVFK